MGYTHHWHCRTDELDADGFARWTRDIHKIIEGLPAHSTSAGGHYKDEPLVLVGDWKNESIPPVLDALNGLVAFNGGGKSSHGERLAHEDFWVERERPNNFCKTDRKPYDLIVCAALIRLVYWFPESIEVTSDGTPADWEPARQFVEELFGVAMLPPDITHAKPVCGC